MLGSTILLFLAFFGCSLAIPSPRTAVQAAQLSNCKAWFEAIGNILGKESRSSAQTRDQTPLTSLGATDREKALAKQQRVAEQQARAISEPCSTRDPSTVLKALERTSEEIRSLAQAVWEVPWRFNFGSARTQWIRLHSEWRIAQYQMDLMQKLDNNTSTSVLKSVSKSVEPALWDTYWKVVAMEDQYNQTQHIDEVVELLGKDKLLIKAFGDTLVSRIACEQKDEAEFLAHTMLSAVDFAFQEYTGKRN